MTNLGTADLMKQASKIHFWNLLCAIYVMWTSRHTGFCKKWQHLRNLSLNVIFFLEIHVHPFVCIEWMKLDSKYNLLNTPRKLHHHHHIHFRALFSSTKGWAFWQVFLGGVLSTQNDFEGQQNPYLASFCHSQTLHPMISLACQIFSVQPHAACGLLQSSLCCALHVQTISSYWCGVPHLSPGCQALWEGSLS